MASQKVLIVGGVAGGASAAARLRRLDEQAQIVLFERGDYISFANCGLPYYIGGEITDKDDLTLQTPESFRARFNVDVRVQNEVTAINRADKTVTVLRKNTGETYTEPYDKLILSMGAEPVVPPIEGIRNGRVFTLRNIPDTYKIKDFIDQRHPKTAVVVGGGYIGVEMAENLHAAGLHVTMVEMLDQVIAPLDFDMAADVHRHIREKGVELLLKTTVKAVREEAGSLFVVLDTGEVQADLVILAIGVRPESKIAKDAGLTVSPRGAIVVTDDMRTSDADIFAVGDAVQVTDFVTGEQTLIPLAGPANKQGRIAADNVCGGDSRYTGTQGSAILKVFDMTVATTGVNEKTAKKLGLSYDKSFTYSASHASYYPGAVNMAVKVVFEKETGKILGGQIVGFEGVDKRIDVLATAIRFGATAKDLTRLELAYAPPYSSAKDPVNMAGFVIENLLSGMVKNIHWHDVQNLPRDGSVTLLDTRTKLEYANGHIDGFQNIPLDSLRSRIAELPKDKPVYVTCQVGLRGYVAARILAQNGFNAYNLAGGYRLYNSIFGIAPVSRVRMNPETQLPEGEKETLPPKITPTGRTIALDACGLQCPGPIVKLSQALKDAQKGDLLTIKTTDPAFACDIEGFCRRTGNCFEGMESSKGIATARIRKGSGEACPATAAPGNGKNIIVFSGDLDKAIASFIIANGAAAMGRKTSMFFTFWGLNILRRPEPVKVRKDFMSRMFGFMMPRGSKKLSLSKMSMGGMGGKMIRMIMKKKNVESLESLIRMAKENGVELIACSMSMDIMGIQPEELIDGVTLGGVAAMLAHAEESDMSLFI